MRGLLGGLEANGRISDHYSGKARRKRRRAMREREATPCALCGRPFDPARLTKHHCLPRERGGSAEDVELLCSQCHGMVHATYTNRTLAAQYPTIMELRK